MSDAYAQIGTRQIADGLIVRWYREYIDDATASAVSLDIARAWCTCLPPSAREVLMNHWRQAPQECAPVPIIELLPNNLMSAFGTCDNRGYIIKIAVMQPGGCCQNHIWRTARHELAHAYHFALGTLSHRNYDPDNLSSVEAAERDADNTTNEWWDATFKSDQKI